MEEKYMISFDDLVTIGNGASSLSRSCSALIILSMALENIDLSLVSEDIADTIMLAVEKIESVEIELRNLSKKLENNNDQA